MRLVPAFENYGSKAISPRRFQSAKLNAESEIRSKLIQEDHEISKYADSERLMFCHCDIIVLSEMCLTEKAKCEVRTQ
jgi:hypothetical protein